MVLSRICGKLGIQQERNLLFIYGLISLLQLTILGPIVLGRLVFQGCPKHAYSDYFIFFGSVCACVFFLCFGGEVVEGRVWGLRPLGIEHDPMTSGCTLQRLHCLLPFEIRPCVLLTFHLFLFRFQLNSMHSCVLVDEQVQSVST